MLERRREWPLLLSCLTTVLFLAFGKAWLADLSNPAWLAVMFGWLFLAIMVAAFAVVRHAEQLAIRFGEPFGTLILTLAMCGMEMMMIAAVMYSGHGSPTLARDTMLAVLMLVLNGLVGVSLLLGGLKYREQAYNLYGAKSFLAVLIPLAVLSLILPNFTATPGPIFSSLQATLLIVMSAGLYVTFLAIQTLRHQEYFVAPRSAGQVAGDSHANTQNDHHDDAHGEPSGHSAAYHAVLLMAYALPIVLLAKQIAKPIDYLIEGLGAPAALGGLLVAVLILSPESMAAVKAALANQLQRSINLSLGTALSSISLTVPAVLIIGFLTDKPVVLGLEPANMVLLALTFVVTMLTFAMEKTNVLLGAVHLLLFCAYLMLMFDR